MCGLIYGRRLDGKTARKMVIKRYRAQKTRGQDGFGYIALNNGKMVEFERRTNEKDILALLDKSFAEEVIFHHRTPTSTPNFAECAHPIKVANAKLKHDYYLIHNGMIANDDELKKKHLELGFEYSTEVSQRWSCNDKVIAFDSKYNDSEALAIELAIDLDKDGDGIPNVTGSIAFIMLQAEKGSKKATRLFFGRNYGNPLKLDVVAGKYIALTSEGAGKEIEAQKLNCIDYATHEHTERDYKVGGYSYSYTGKMGFGGYGDDYDWESHYDSHNKKQKALEAPKKKGYDTLDARSVEQVLEDDKYLDLWEEYEDKTEELDGEEDDNARLVLEARIGEIEHELETIENANLQRQLDADARL